MTKREIRKLVRQKIGEGKSQYQVFEEIDEICDRPSEDIAEIVKAIPTLKARRKYRITNGILINLLLIISGLEIFTAISLISETGMQRLAAFMLFLIIMIFLIIGVAKYSRHIYFFSGIFAMILFIQMTHDIEKGPLIYIKLAVLASVFGVALFLQSKLTPGYKIYNEKVTNNQGEQRLRNVIVFKDKND